MTRQRVAVAQKQEAMLRRWNRDGRRSSARHRFNVARRYVLNVAVAKMAGATLFTRYLFAADLLLMFPARSHVYFTLMQCTWLRNCLRYAYLDRRYWERLAFLVQPQTEKTCQVSCVSKC